MTVTLAAECETNIDDCIEVNDSEKLMVSVWMECFHTPVSVTLASLEWTVRWTLMTVWGSTVVEMVYVCLDDVNAFTCECSPGVGGTLCIEGM